MAEKVRKKLCGAGHVMEASWDVCPYCPGEEEGLGSTRIREGSRAMSLPSRGEGAPLVGWLVALTGRHRGEAFPLGDGKSIIGMDESCQVRLLDDDVSETHARITCDASSAQGQFQLADLDSTHGTFLNGRSSRIDREEVVDNDLLRFAGTEMILKGLPCGAISRIRS